MARVKLNWMLAAVLIGVSGLAWAAIETAQVPRFRAEANKVVMFDGRFYSGLKQAFSADISNLKGTLIGNDKIRSIRVPAGIEVTLFEHSEFRGRKEVLTEDDPDLSNNTLGLDRVSSFKIRKLEDQ